MGRTPDERRLANRRGAEAEARVGRLLEEQGWRVLARNWIAKGGELDLVVARGAVLRIVEVKAREADDPVGLEAVSASKRRRLVRAARQYLNEYEDIIDEVAFMVALVQGEQITIIDDAFDA